MSTRTVRGVDPVTLAAVRDLSWIKKRLNVLITGPCGVGKSHFASALAHAACRQDFSARCFRLPRLAEELARAHTLQRRSSLLRQLAKIDVILIDDFGLAVLTDQIKRDVLEILDDRYDRIRQPLTSGTPFSHSRAVPLHSADMGVKLRPGIA